MKNPEQVAYDNREKQQFSFQVRVVGLDELVADLDSIAARISSVASDGFGPGKEMSPERIARRLSKEPYVILAEEGQELVGFQFQSLHETDTQKYLYYSRVIKKNKQGKGIAQMLLSGAIDAYAPTVIGARSQNPAEILSFTKAMRRRGIAKVYPFTTEEEKLATQSTLIEFLEVIGFSDKVDLLTGLGQQSYPEGRLGDYEIHLNNPEIVRIEDYLISIGLSRADGDSVFYFAQLANAKNNDK